MVNSDDSKGSSVALTGASVSALAGPIGSKTRHRTPDNANKFRKEVIDGDDWNQDEGKIVNKVRIIDKDANSYIEKVVDKETGEVLQDVDELLTDHHGHGSDKPPGTPA